MLLAFSHRNARDAEELPATQKTRRATRRADETEDEEILVPEAVE
jgi:hypothetical protein